MSEDGEKDGVPQALLRQQAALARFGEHALREFDLDRVLHEAAAQVAAGLDCEIAKVLQYDPGYEQLLIRAGVGLKPGIVGTARVPGNGGSAAGHAIETGAPVLTEDTGAEDRFEISWVVREHGVRSLANVVIPGDPQPWGVLEVDTRTRRVFTRSDADFLQSYANLISAAVYRNRCRTALQATIAERDLMLREMQHRVKNSLQLVASLLHLQRRGIADPDGRRAIDHVASRIDAIAAAHDQLSTTRQGEMVTMDGYLRVLCEAAAPGRAEVAIEVEADRWDLPLDVAVPLGLIVNEALTNSVKYAFPDGAGGTVRVLLRHLAGEGAGELAVMDDGRGMGPRRPGSSGLRLVEALARQIGGALDLASEPGRGTRLALRFPVPA
ncbi:MAG TPA: histidine kinase dimerization/phosphoacceptor domain -containing protein [Azospirillaceae bacterium]|nr:histidine kinase dimerization/phosphoacceptor domain -containing protein [Azospirillaceae bacterium]